MKNLLSLLKNILRPGMNWRPISELPYDEYHLLFKANTGQGFVYYVGGTVEGRPAGMPESLIPSIEGFIKIRP